MISILNEMYHANLVWWFSFVTDETTFLQWRPFGFESIPPICGV